jgi:hypothetical protein
MRADEVADADCGLKSSANVVEDEPPEGGALLFGFSAMDSLTIVFLTMEK